MNALDRLRESKEEGGKIEKTKRRKRGREERIVDK